MNCIIVLSAFAAVVFAQPSNLHGVVYGRNEYPLNYGSPYGHTAESNPNVYYTHYRDSSEVAAAKAQQASERENEKFSMAANEAARIIQHYAHQPAPGTYSPYANYGDGYAPSYRTRYGNDGRDGDSPEVAAAKFHQAVSHVNEKYNQATNEAARKQNSYPRFSPGLHSGYSGYGASSPSYRNSREYEQRVVDTPEVAAAKVQHAAAYVTAGIDHAREVARNEAVFRERNLSGPYYAGSYGYGAPAPPPAPPRTYESPIVAFIKAQHAAAYVNEGINHAREIAKNDDVYRERNLSGSSNSGYSSPLHSQGTVYRNGEPITVYDSRT